MNRRRIGPYAGVAALWLGGALAAATAWAVELPQHAADKHMGVATCASAVCHGRVQEELNGAVRQDEYRTWSKHDRHARAYQTLHSEESRQIARKLGLNSAFEADICLDCHADNVAETSRGFKFHIEDGVGCEACHGGSERWLTSHAVQDAKHQNNLRTGMYPTDEIGPRAELCLSCHLGTSKKFPTHRIMGAGHPRLSFELDTFTIRAPEHYRVDDDYRQRKSDEKSTGRWAVGALVAGRRYAQLLQSPLFMDHPLYPEIGLFDCHSCHESLNELEWKIQPATASLGPGQVRLNDSSLLIAAVVLSQHDKSQGDKLYALIQSMHAAAAESRQSVRRVTSQISSLLILNEAKIAAAKLSSEQLRAARQQLLDLGESGEFHDYAGAEQAVMSIDVLSFAIADLRPEVESSLRRMYELVNDDDHYRSSGLIEEFRAFRDIGDTQ